MPKKLSKYRVFIDGASRGNPGPASVGVVFQGPDGETVKTLSQRIGVSTNNVAEYSALIFAMQEGMILKASELEIFTDSELLAKQIAGEYKIKDDFLKVLYQFTRHLKAAYSKVSVTHVGREQNKLADKLANQALDAQDLFL